MWNYAELTKLAKESGGPEALIKIILNTGINNGRIEGIIGTVLVGGTIYGIYKLHEFVNERINTDEEYIMAKNEIINKANEICNEESQINKSEGGQGIC